MIVADTSLIASLLLVTPATTEAEAVFEKDPTWVAPTLWRSEFRNVLATQIRVLGLSLNDAIALFKKAEEVIAEPERTPDTREILRLADDKKLSGYDAEYVALAHLLKVKLITLDTGILKAAAQYSISPKDFLRGTS